MHEFVFVYRLFKRMLTEPKHLIANIDSWGGEVRNHRMIGHFRKTPFPSLRSTSFLYEFRTNHGNRQGFWFARTSDDGNPPDWAWHDCDGIETLPITGVRAEVVADPEGVSFALDSYFLGCLILMGVVTGIMVILAFG